MILEKSMTFGTTSLFMNLHSLQRDNRVAIFVNSSVDNQVIKLGVS